MEQSKACTKCGQIKPFSEFYKSKRYKSGVQSACKRCSYEQVKASITKKPEHYHQKNREWQVKNRKLLSDLARKYYWENPEVYRSRSRKYSSQNKDLIAVKNFVYKSENAVRLNKQTKEWRIKNPDKVVEQNNRRRQRVYKNGLFAVSAKEVRKLMSRPCFYCAASSQHLDHVVPVSRGGRHSIGNLVPSCQKCNQSKANKFITEWQRDLRKRSKFTTR